MKLVSLWVVLFLAFFQHADTQFVRLPSKLKPKDDKVMLSKTKETDLIEFIRSLLNTENLLKMELKGCQFTDDLFTVSFHGNRIRAVTRKPPVITYTAFKHSIIIYINVMSLEVSGGIGHTSLIENGPDLQPAVYSAKASGISCVILYSRIKGKVTFCRCRINKVDSIRLRAGFQDMNPQRSSNSTALGAISSSLTSTTPSDTNPLYEDIKTCVKRILKKGLCQHFKTQTNDRKTELEKIFSYSSY